MEKCEYQCPNRDSKEDNGCKLYKNVTICTKFNDFITYEKFKEIDVFVAHDYVEINQNISNEKQHIQLSIVQMPEIIEKILASKYMDPENIKRHSYQEVYRRKLVFKEQG